jgi:hypothetical protein
MLQRKSISRQIKKRTNHALCSYVAILTTRIGKTITKRSRLKSRLHLTPLSDDGDDKMLQS